MFNFHGMKWPKSKEFVQSERAVGEFKVVNFVLGVPLIILTFILRNPDNGLPVIGTYQFLVVFCASVFLAASWMEDYPKFSIAFASATCVTAGCFTICCLIYFIPIQGFTSSSTVACFFMLYAGMALYMAIRAFRAMRFAA